MSDRWLRAQHEEGRKKRREQREKLMKEADEHARRKNAEQQR